MHEARNALNILLDGPVRYRSHFVGGLWEIDDKVLDLLAAHQQEGSRHYREAGGLLIGTWSSSLIHVDEITEPGERDERGPFTFGRIDATHNAAVRRAFAANPRRNYCGEWHTHNEPTPRPSPQDVQTWRDELREPQTPMVSLFVIIGTQRIRAWEGVKGSGRICEVLPLRADGFPLCPKCGEDEAYSLTSRPDQITGCYRCGPLSFEPLALPFETR